MKAKALREQLEAKSSARNGSPSSVVAGTKRPFAATKESTPTMRDASSTGAQADAAIAAGVARPLDDIRPARNFTRYVEYDFSKMTDTKGGFLSAEDDPHNKALHAERDGDEAAKPAGMTMAEWEKQRLLKSLRAARQGPFEPGISGLVDKEDESSGKVLKCRECGTLEVDFKWAEELKCVICQACKDKFPEKYSLLTKTEAREDYLLTDREFHRKELFLISVY